MGISGPRVGQQLTGGELARADALTASATGAEPGQLADALPGELGRGGVAVFGVQGFHEQTFALGGVFFALEQGIDRTDVEAFTALCATAFHLNTPCRD